MVNQRKSEEGLKITMSIEMLSMINRSRDYILYSNNRTRDFSISVWGHCENGEKGEKGGGSMVESIDKRTRVLGS